MRHIERPSPNQDERGGAAIDMLVLHYTGMPTAEAALERLCDPQARVSAHYAIDEGGTIHALVPEARRAWHAGISFWAGARDINARSIGIELVNPGHEFGYRIFAEAQIVALTGLCQEILARHAIVPWRVLGHSDVAPDRKEDPGELFPWKSLAETGIGLWPVESDDPGAEAVASVAFSLNAALGVPVQVDVVVLDEIPPAANGKYRPYYSLVGQACTEGR